MVQTISPPDRPKSIPFQARNVTGSKTLAVDVESGLRAEEVARSVAELLALPSDTPWALREDDSAQFLDGDRAIGEQIHPGARVTVTPRAHLGGGT
jgi:hypothetical protein